MPEPADRPPSGCRYCGHPERGHFQRWHESVHWHTWMRPTDAQTKQRMLARRADRITARAARYEVQPTGLRDQIAEALPCPVCPAQAGDPCVRAREDNQQPHMSRLLRADAAMHVVEAETARARASCCEDGERTYAEMERHLTQRAEQAKRERDTAREALDAAAIVIASLRDQCDQAHKAIADERRGRLASEAAARGVQALIDSYPPGSRFARSGAQALFRAALDAEQPKETP